ncbi:MAG TPA: hypothetical protein VHR42_06215, partial [Clostridia bacterium]|nr:hypothetical protein [Clostridia bacterium]
MKIPQMDSRQDKNIDVIPNGGLNLSVLPNLIEDDQSPDMLNLWYKDKAVSIRPALIKKIEQAYGKIIDVCPKDGRPFLIYDDPGALNDVSIYGVFIATKTAVLYFDGTNITRVPTGFHDNGDKTYTNLYDDLNLSNAKFVESNKSYINGDVGNWQGNLAILIGDGHIFEVGLHNFGHLQTGLITEISIKEISYSKTLTTDYEWITPYVPTTYINLTPSG